MNATIDIPGFRADALRKGYAGRPVLAGLDLCIPQGAVVGLLGANGAGKTTLLRILLGLLPSDGGRAYVLSESAEHLSPELRARIGYVPQSPSQFAWLTGNALLKYLAAFYPRFDRAYARSLTERWQVSLGTPIGALSPGQQQRLSIVRALASRPDLIVMDEPIAALDPATRIEVIEELQRLRQERAITLLFSSHILGDLQRLCTEFAVLAQGKIVESAPVSAFTELARLTLEGPEALLATCDFSRCRRARKSREGQRLALLSLRDIQAWRASLPSGVAITLQESDLELVVSEWMR